ncbi:hypothetical protein GCM10007916_14290 [Psychromonas marina]|uniref:Uncharacterized protein n=1 Tax=Psychromonas marina TaxID=88364 RepID=A0ABQ6DZ75_9GAMM|nr:hypothetical protein GCM10007916_14290 [Psychromonas marina]
MNQSQLVKYLSNLVQSNDINNELEFIEFLQSNQNVKDYIIGNCEDVFWLYFERHTYDGWYCVKDDRLEWYYVCFQEHGTTSLRNRGIETKIHEEAITKVLVYHGSLKF